MPLATIGIDPGLASIGWGVIETFEKRSRYVAHGVIETRSNTKTAERLSLIYDAIQEILKRYEPSFGAIETLYFSKNISSALPVSEARGVLLLALSHARVAIDEFTPLQIKQSLVGSGRATKSQVQQMTKLLLGLSSIPQPDHAADALAVAISSIHARGFYA